MYKAEVDSRTFKTYFHIWFKESQNRLYVQPFTVSISFCYMKMQSIFGDHRKKYTIFAARTKKYRYDTKKKKNHPYPAGYCLCLRLRDDLGIVHPSVDMGVLAAAVCIISFVIALMLGVPIDSKGFPSDDGLQPRLWIDSLHQRFEPLPILLRSDWHWARLFVSAR